MQYSKENQTLRKTLLSSDIPRHVNNFSLLFHIEKDEFWDVPMAREQD